MTLYFQLQFIYFWTLNYIDDLKVKLYSSIANFIVGRPKTSLKTDSYTAEDNSYAIQKLIAEVPVLFNLEETPYIQGAIFSWQRSYSSRYGVPALDLVFPDQGLIFVLHEPARRVNDATASEENSENKSSYLRNTEDTSSNGSATDTYAHELLGQSSSSSVYSDEVALSSIFRNQIRNSDDPIPLVPIFIDPFKIISCHGFNDLSELIDSSWHSSLLWALAQLPTITEDTNLDSPEPWVLRRLWIEEALKTSLFPIN